MSDHLDDFIKCANCGKIYSNPKILPCFHTCCQNCIELIAKAKSPQRKIPCPVCGRAFKLPRGGAVKLRGNFFMEKLVEIATAFRTDGTRCDICEDGESNYAAAKWLCLCCCENLCNRCCKHHLKANATKYHTCIDLPSSCRQNVDAKLSKGNPCTKHSDNMNDLYCSDCLMAICVQCFDEHNGHRCTNSVKQQFDRILNGSKTARSQQQYASIKKNDDLISDFLECPICSGVFDDSRVLPCFHMFCLKCIRGAAAEKSTRQVPCPVCRGTFNVPPNGIKELPENLFVKSLLKVAKVSTKVIDGAKCAICTEDDQRCYVGAKWRCLQCGENLCNRCCKIHKKMTATKSHKYADLSSYKDDELRFCRSTFCENHPDKTYELYCIACEVILCVECLREQHDDHRCFSLKTRFRELRQELKLDIILLSGRAFKLHVDCERFKGEILYTEESRTTRKAELERLGGNRRELKRIKRETLTELKQIKTTTAEHIAALESFLTALHSIVYRSTPSELCRRYEKVHSKATDLLAIYLPTVDGIGKSHLKPRKVLSKYSSPDERLDAARCYLEFIDVGEQTVARFLPESMCPPPTEMSLLIGCRAGMLLSTNGRCYAPLPNTFPNVVMGFSGTYD